jgi:undecaprenyl phosphate-alpha-L-ara4FN deformylase
MTIPLGLKIDVDTERGTRLGVPYLQELFKRKGIQATFLFALGPDNTGRALRRIFRPGFFKKVSRTSVLSVYGLRTLTHGLFGNGPHIGKKHGDILRSVETQGHEVGIHCYDHVYWQDKLHKMHPEEVHAEVKRAVDVFCDIFGHMPHTMGAAGWQANVHSLSAYDTYNLRYASDTRGHYIFLPSVFDEQGIKHTFKTPQVPSTLPTLDELVGLPEFPLERMNDYFLSLIRPGQLNVFTLHAELEGMYHAAWFESFLDACLENGINPCPVWNVVQDQIQEGNIPEEMLLQGNVEGRSGFLAVQGS